MASGSVITIGNFDGVHLGHQALLRRCRRTAAPIGATSVAITFEPSPAAVLRPGSEPPRLMSPATKRATLLQHVDAAVVLEPTPDLLGQTPEQFVDWLVGEYSPRAIVEGPDFHFGKDRAGTLDVLRTLGKRHGFDVLIETRTEVALSDQLMAPVTSSLVRWLVGRGRVVDAATCLGRPFALAGPVVRGEQQGRTLGIPTANLDPASYAGLIVPADGVYAGYAILADRTPRPAAISVGTKPTFGVSRLTVEAHLIDYQPEPFESLYGQTMTLAFTRWLRDQWRFPSIDALRAQLARDLDDTRRLAGEGALRPAAAEPSNRPIAPA